jgi:SagB-type dehydrogenase family enzyme
MIHTSAQYHQQTSYKRHEMTGHFLDWENQPTVFKTYPGVTPVQLPGEIQFPDTTLCSLLKKAPTRNRTPPSLGIEDVSRVLMLTCRLTARARHANGEFYYRSAASAGALYPTEIYVAPQGVNGIDDGLYHFSIAHHGLSPLRKENPSAWIVKSAGPMSVKTPLLTFFFSAIFFRSAWKYRDRSYRYHLLDTGHVLENLTLAFKAMGLPYTLFYDFDDYEVNRLLGLDDFKEVSLALCQIPGNSPLQGQKEDRINEIPDQLKTASRVAQKEIDYPAIREIHTAGVKKIFPSEPAPQMVHELGVIPDTWMKIETPPAWPETTGYPESVFGRRSRRNFVPEPISQACLFALLDALCTTESKSNATSSNPYQTLSTGFFAGRAQSFEPGFYLLDCFSESYGIISRESIVERMAHICLDQAWLANAAVHFVFMTNLHTLDRMWGARGYRYAMMTAGMMGERLYLAAEAMGLGCCGIGAFYDREAAEALNLNTESRLLYLVAVGVVKGLKRIR